MPYASETRLEGFTATFGADRVLIVGNRSNVSTDGQTWSEHAMDGDESVFNSVAWGSGIFLAVGHRPPAYQAIRAISTDGMTWAVAPLPAHGPFGGIVAVPR